MKTKLIKVVNHLDEIISTKKQFNISETILIAGSPRSGTTWLMEIFGKIPSYRYIFEPLNPNWYPESARIGFKSRTYLPMDLNWPQGEEYLSKIFTGKIINSKFGPSYINNLQSMFFSSIADKLIVKEVRINRLLPWITKRFQLKKIYLTIRHPCAVISSQLHTGYTAYHPENPPYTDIFPTIENILNEASKIDGLEPSLLNKIKNLKTRDEFLAATWCLDNYIPLYAQKPQKWKTIIYEKFYKNEEKELNTLFNLLGFSNISKSAIAHFRVPSKTTRKDNWKTIQSKDEQLMKWKEILSEKQISRILKVVSDFNMDFYSKDIEPDYDRLSKETNII